MSTSNSDIQKMQEALDLPDALEKLTNSDRALEQAAARHHPASEDDDTDAQDGDVPAVRPTPPG